MNTPYKGIETENTPFKDFAVTNWIESNVEDPRSKSTIDLMKTWLDAEGIKSPIDSDWLKMCMSAIKIYLAAWIPDRTVYPLEDLLKNGAFWLRTPRGYGWEKGGVAPNAKLMKIINAHANNSMVYELEPKHYYFEVVKRNDNRTFLYVNYQHLIGGRKLVEVSL